MGDIRFERHGSFATMPNCFLRDKRLSLRTKGLFAVMYSLPTDWDYSIAGLATINGVGKDTIRGALKEMEEAGYLEREGQSHGEHGKFAANVYVIHEESLATPDVSPSSENPTTVEPTTDNPSSGGPSSDNPTQLSKDKRSKDRENTPYIPPAGDEPAPSEKKRGRRQKSVPAWRSERFEGFWTYYPCHEDRVSAVREWDRLKPPDELIEQMGRALVRQKASARWREGIGIPYACRWLRNERWKDEPSAMPASAGSVPGPVVEDTGVRAW